MTGLVLSALLIFTHLIFTIVLWGNIHNFPYFMVKDTECAHSPTASNNQNGELNPRGLTPESMTTNYKIWPLQKRCEEAAPRPPAGKFTGGPVRWHVSEHGPTVVRSDCLLHRFHTALQHVSSPPYLRIHHACRVAMWAPSFSSCSALGGGPCAKPPGWRRAEHHRLSLGAGEASCTTLCPEGGSGERGGGRS